MNSVLWDKSVGNFLFVKIKGDNVLIFKIDNVNLNFYMSRNNFWGFLIF